MRHPVQIGCKNLPFDPHIHYPTKAFVEIICSQPPVYCVDFMQLNTITCSNQREVR